MENIIKSRIQIITSTAQLKGKKNTFKGHLRLRYGWKNGNFAIRKGKNERMIEHWEDDCSG